MKTYYYQFNKFDKTFVAMALGFVIFALTGFRCSCSWIVFIVLALIWAYKTLMKQVAVVITDKGIKIDHSKSLPWKDIEDGEIKVVNLCGKKMKVLALNPKKGIKYHYSWLQKHNAHFGPFPIPLYGILSPKDEKEIVQSIKKHVRVK